MKLTYAAMLVLALTATPVLAQVATTNPSTGTTVVTTPRADANRAAETVVVPHHEEESHGGWGWLGLLGLVGLAGLRGKKCSARDKGPVVHTTSPNGIDPLNRV